MTRPSSSKELKAFAAHQRDATAFRFRIPASRRSFMIRIVASCRTLGQLRAASPRVKVGGQSPMSSARRRSVRRTSCDPATASHELAVVPETATPRRRPPLRADPLARGAWPNSRQQPHLVCALSAASITSPVDRRRREPILHVLPAESKVTPYTVRTRTHLFVAPGVQGLHWDVKVPGHLARGCELWHPGVRPWRSVSCFTRHRVEP